MRFSLSSWKSAGGASAKKTQMLLVIGVLGAGAVGYKMFWPEAVPLKANANFKSPSSLTQKPAANASRGVAGKGATANTGRQPANGKVTRNTKQTASDDSDLPAANDLASRSARPMPATNPSPAPMSEILGPVFVDENNGFAMRFPAAWPIRSFVGEPWVLDCGDGKTSLISIGFSTFPADFNADNIPPEWVARRIKKRNDTILHAQGYAIIAGKKALWSKSTGPLPMTNASPKMTRVNYIIPLGDGRVMELRIATSPELFDQLMPTMRTAVESFKLIPRTPGSH